MAKSAISNIKLGVFVLAGLFFLILLLYMIGKNRNLFGANFILKVRFENVQGLKPGNNVRYAGIDVGTVKRINLINDTVMEVLMTIDEKAKRVIHRNAVVSIATDGLVGNKVVNITSARAPAPTVEDGDELVSRRPVDTDEMIRALSRTNRDVSVIAENLKITVTRLNNSTALWSVLNEKGLPQNLRLAGYHIRLAAEKASDMVNNLDTIVGNVKQGRGSLGAILTDTALAFRLNGLLLKLEQVSDDADSLSRQLEGLVEGVRSDVNTGKGTVNALLKDSTMVIRLNKSLDNIRQGTEAFNENMEALKHNFLFRGYFRKQEKRRKQDSLSRLKQE
jgi:phospholipid/cholesterol/gamma-HCH transport system substrate-binding protein